jgi:hypothetical protein
MPNTPPPPPDTYESSTEVGTDAPTFKFYQVGVPSFSFNQTGDQTGVTRSVPNVGGHELHGSSFLRMGSFPDVTSKEDNPPGFKASLKLANLVGRADDIWAAAQGPGASLPYNGDPNSAVPDADVAPNTYNGDPNFMLGFVNDTRLQSPDPNLSSPPPPAPPPPKHGLAESLVLLTKGGWWDHSDGNRITTTAGDKVEIIQGNYKLVLLGRQKVPDRDDSNYANDLGNVLARSDVIDISGGITIDNNTNPDALVKSVEYTQDLDGSWTQYENGGIGSVYSSFYGKTGDLFLGPLQESWTGQPPAGFPQTDFYTNATTQSSTFPSQTDPDVKEYTWANSITSYTGSEDKTIPSITEHTFAGDMTSYTGSARTPVRTITETTYAGTITGVTNATAITDVTNAAAVTEETNAGAVTGVTVAGAAIDVTLAALKADIFVGALAVDISLGGKIEVHAGAKLSIDVGAAYEIEWPEKSHASMGDTTEADMNKIRTSITELTTSMNRSDFALTRRINALVVELGI